MGCVNRLSKDGDQTKTQPTRRLGIPASAYNLRSPDIILITAQFLEELEAYREQAKKLDYYPLGKTYFSHAEMCWCQALEKRHGVKYIRRLVYAFATYTSSPAWLKVTHD
jgi:hypothetical protein